MLASSEIHNNHVPVPVVESPSEEIMEAGNGVRLGSGPFAYSPLARDAVVESGEVAAEHVVNVDDLLRSRQFAPEQDLEAGGEDGRRQFSDPSLERQASLRQGLTGEVQHVASETYLITRLAFTLLKYLGIGIRWLFQLIRLGLYALCLMPGFIQVGYYYFFSKNIQRSLVYGDHPRNRFDLYLPAGRQPRPAVIFITGGAWVIGYKAWGALLARQLVERNIIVACIDYRNFPQGSISDMVSDVSRGIGYVCQNIVDFGGDPNMIYLVGQSAGAHLGACALLIQALEQAREESSGSNSAELAWKASQMKAYLALSGGYNLTSLTAHFHKRGLYKSMFFRIMEGEDSLATYSPECIVRSPAFRDAVPLLPPITLFHGTADYSIPYEASVEFADTLLAVGATVHTVLYADKTHTDLILQDPMRGGKIDMLADILAVVHADDEEERAEDAVAMMRPRMVPECLLQLAHWINLYVAVGLKFPYSFVHVVLRKFFPVQEIREKGGSMKDNIPRAIKKCSTVTPVSEKTLGSGD